jgi:hypothetical protein
VAAGLLPMCVVLSLLNSEVETISLLRMDDLAVNGARSAGSDCFTQQNVACSKPARRLVGARLPWSGEELLSRAYFVKPLLLNSGLLRAVPCGRASTSQG